VYTFVLLFILYSKIILEFDFVIKKMYKKVLLLVLWKHSIIPTLYMMHVTLSALGIICGRTHCLLWKVWETIRALKSQLTSN